MAEPDPNELDKQLALLKQAVETGFSDLRRDIQKLTLEMVEDVDHVRGDLAEVNALACENREKLEDIRPFVLAARKTWEIAWKIIVIALVAGLLWATVQSGSFLP